MMQTLNPYTGGNSTARTAEIMARYRPIAPRPLTSSSSSNGASHDQCDNSGSGSGGSGSMSPTIRQSPYLRNVWPHLQSRPTRTRKRGRTSLGPPPTQGGRGAPSSFKRPRSTLLQGLSPTTTTTTLVTLPLLPFATSVTYQHNHNNHNNNNHNNNMHQTNVSNNVVFDINKVVPEEKDLLGLLQKPKPKVIISPTPIRLIPSTVTIQGIKEYYDHSHSSVSILKNSKDIEKELESQLLPAFVSDSNNKVRLVNSAYKQMVGQPECSWLESIVTLSGLGVACKTICGEVVLDFMDQEKGLSQVGFSCWARIEWVGNNVNGNKKKNFVNAFGEAIRLECEAKNYKLAWRFHTRETSDLTPAVSM